MRPNAMARLNTGYLKNGNKHALKLVYSRNALAQALTAIHTYGHAYTHTYKFRIYNDAIHTEANNEQERSISVATAAG